MHRLRRGRPRRARRARSPSAWCVIDARRAPHAGGPARLEAHDRAAPRGAGAPSGRLGAIVGRRRGERGRDRRARHHGVPRPRRRARVRGARDCRSTSSTLPLISRRQPRLAERGASSIGARASRPASRPTATARPWPRHPSSPRCTATAACVVRTWPPRSTLGREQGLLEPRRTSRPSTSTARASCTARPGCTSGRPRRRRSSTSA